MEFITLQICIIIYCISVWAAHISARYINRNRPSMSLAEWCWCYFSQLVPVANLMVVIAALTILIFDKEVWRREIKNPHFKGKITQ